MRMLRKKKTSASDCLLHIWEKKVGLTRVLTFSTFFLGKIMGCSGIHLFSKELWNCPQFEENWCSLLKSGVLDVISLEKGIFPGWHLWKCEPRPLPYQFYISWQQNKASSQNSRSWGLMKTSRVAIPPYFQQVPLKITDHFRNRRPIRCCIYRWKKYRVKFLTEINFGYGKQYQYAYFFNDKIRTIDV